MIKSMTGYGRSQTSYGNYLLVCELKGVNHKFSHFHLHLDRRFSFLELELRKLLKEHISRGRVDLYLDIEEVSVGEDKIKVNRPVLEKYIMIYKNMQEEYGIEGEMTWESLLQLPEVISIQEEASDLEGLGEIILELVREALEAFIGMRIEEGRRMKDDIQSQLNRLAGLVAEVGDRLPDITAEFRQSLLKRIESVLERTIVDQDRLLEEIAYFAEKSNVNEEMVRLQSHIKQFTKTLASSKPVGRKLDFIAQELYREANTIGSKTPDAAVGNKVVEMKTVIDKIREQIQNIE